ncbi:MAG: DNA repair protein, partial [archaeon]|nr:DNA repair protein [archaeon]
MYATLAQDQIARKGADAVKFFEYGDTEKEYLSSKDPKLAEIISQVGHIYECVDTDLYTSLVRIIIGQQITIALYEKTWAEFQKI